MLGLFCHVQVGVLMESYFDEVVLTRIALSCHFAIDLLCEEAELLQSISEACHRGIITLLEFPFRPSCVTVALSCHFSLDILCDKAEMLLQVLSASCAWPLPLVNGRVFV